MSSDRLGIASDVERLLERATHRIIVARVKEQQRSWHSQPALKRGAWGARLHFGPSWSVRRLAAPRSMVGPVVFPGSPPTLNTHLVPPGVCGSWPLLAVWDPRFSWTHREPSTHIWSLLECAAPGRSAQYGSAVFLDSPRTLNTHLVPPGVCGSWPLRAIWTRGFLGSPRTSTPGGWVGAKGNCHSSPWCQNANTNTTSTTHTQEHRQTHLAVNTQTLFECVQHRPVGPNRIAFDQRSEPTDHTTAIPSVNPTPSEDSIPSVDPTLGNSHTITTICSWNRETPPIICIPPWTGGPHCAHGTTPKNVAHQTACGTSHAGKPLRCFSRTILDAKHAFHLLSDHWRQYRKDFRRFF